jgi:hypothetical protein
MLRVRQSLPLFLALLVSSAAYAVALALTSSSVDQLGMGEGNVDRYYIRVLSASVNVDSDDFNNQITGGSVTVASTSTVLGTYVVTITVTTSAGTRTFTTTATLSTTPATITFTITPPLSYTAPGVTISVRADPA